MNEWIANGRETWEAGVKKKSGTEEALQKVPVNDFQKSYIF